MLTIMVAGMLPERCAERCPKKAQNTVSEEEKLTV